jgi:hypothetical protein
MKANEQDDRNWELLPCVGLGKVAFSMNKLQVGAFDDVIGRVTAERNSLDQREQLQATYDLLKEFFTEDDLKTAMETTEMINGQRGLILMEYRQTGLALEYESDHLTEIFADTRAKYLHFQGISVFSSNPVNFVKEMAAILMENPLIKGEEAVFQKANIYLFNFIKESGVEGDPNNRSIMWRKNPRPLGEDLSTYRVLEILQ